MEFMDLAVVLIPTCMFWVSDHNYFSQYIKGYWVHGCGGFILVPIHSNNTKNWPTPYIVHYIGSSILFTANGFIFMILINL